MSNVNSRLAAGNPFEAKDYLTKQNLETSGAMNAANAAEKQAEGATVARTGTNSAALANTVASSARQGQRDLTAYNAARDTANEQEWLKQQDQLMKDQLAGAQSEADVYKTGIGGQSSDLSSMTSADNAAQAAEFGLIDSAVGAGGAVGAAFCPARGSRYLMADGTECAVEDLRCGDTLQGIDGKPQVVEEIQSANSPVIRTATEGGKSARTSPTHAWALPFGGFAVAARANGVSIRVLNEIERIVSVEPAGADLVFNVITDGSHTYRVNGMWYLGVGDAERHVDMKTWGEIGKRMVQAGE
jgi:hypothetical protein